MGKFAHNDVLDAPLNYVRSNSTRLAICSDEPATFAEANATYMLGTVTVDTSDFTIGDDGSGGRKATVAAQNGVTIDAGVVVPTEANHLALLDVVNSKLLIVTTMPAKEVLGGGVMDVAAWDITHDLLA